MALLDLGILPASFTHDYRDEITAAVSVAVALVLAALVDRAFARAGRAAQAVSTGRGGGTVSPAAATRVRFVRRLVVASIVLIGVLIALAQFGTLSRVATSVLASGALAAAVIGFAARQVLANSVAGVMLAITQPLRIGDRVEFEGESGTVEDVRLNYTYLRSGAGTRVVIPNERLASGVLHNDTIVSPLGEVEISAWLEPEADTDRALEVLGALEAVTGASVAEIAREGVRIDITAEPVPSARRAERAAQLRAQALRALRAAGLLPRAGNPSPRA
jgi:small-conductance mechanosensitive channel